MVQMNSRYEPYFKGQFFPSTLLVDFDLVLWHAVTENEGDERPVQLDEFKKYLKWYAPWDGSFSRYNPWDVRVFGE